MANNLNTDGYVHFDDRFNEKSDEENKEFLIASLENSMGLTEQLAKKFRTKDYTKIKQNKITTKMERRYPNEKRY